MTKIHFADVARVCSQSLIEPTDILQRQLAGEVGDAHGGY